MGIYIEIEKPEGCGYCLLVGGYAEAPGKLFCPAHKCERVEDTTVPDWCPIIEVTKEEYEIGRKCVEEVKRALDEAAIYGKPKRLQTQEWNAQRFYNMDSALTRIEELARQMQEEAKKISDIVNEGFTVKRYGGYGDESRTEDA